MQDLMKALPHLVMATVVIAATVTLASLHIISGADALPVIIGVGGFTLGGTVASGSISTVTGATAEASNLASIGPPQTPPQPSTVTTLPTTGA